MNPLSGSRDSVFRDDGQPPARVEGWIKVVERGVKFSHRGNSNHYSSLRWRLQYCVLDFKSRKLHHFSNELEARSVQTSGSHVLKMSRFNTEYYSMKWNHSYCAPRHGLATPKAKNKADLSSTLPRKLPKYTAASLTLRDYSSAILRSHVIPSAPQGRLRNISPVSYGTTISLTGIYEEGLKRILFTDGLSGWVKHDNLKTPTPSPNSSAILPPHPKTPTTPISLASLVISSSRCEANKSSSILPFGQDEDEDGNKR
ncbi:uncharacterized protein LOC117303314 [Asterias rubens]|uniref:uncharacterized protein LOC117303314 n=1 Tax=Asterias rubens TaxID=7604 RepID=UPI0014556576|nr:uncharacterized protein LOC117303314 [Asterias rubens]